MKNFLAGITALLALTACSIISPVVDKGGEEVARVVDQYCDAMDTDARETLRDAVNGHLDDGRSVIINCGG